MRDTWRNMLGRWVAPLVRLHRDERGDALEYALVLAVFAIPLMIAAGYLREILTDWFSMLSYHVGWPFL